MIKPFRLINAVELKSLEQQFSLALRNWNEQYSLNPLELKLSLPPKKCTGTKLKYVKEEQHILALIDEQYLSIVNQALFGEDNPCFDTAGEEILKHLLKELFKTAQCSIRSNSDTVVDWFYPGSTCLLLVISCGSSNFTLILNPDWVYKNLSPTQRIPANLNKLEDVLTEQRVHLNLELMPLTLPLHQLINLQPGDVLVSDHALTSNLLVTYDEKLLAKAELGQSSHRKSIIIKRSS